MDSMELTFLKEPLKNDVAFDVIKLATIFLFETLALDPKEEQYKCPCQPPFRHCDITMGVCKQCWVDSECAVLDTTCGICNQMGMVS